MARRTADLRGTVLQKLPKGLLLTNTVGEIKLLKGLVGEGKFSKGDLVGSWAVPAGTIRYKNALGEESTAPAFMTIKLDP
jgi:hypothetical protein